MANERIVKIGQYLMNYNVVRMKVGVLVLYGPPGMVIACLLYMYGICLQHYQPVSQQP